MKFNIPLFACVALALILPNTARAASTPPAGSEAGVTASIKKRVTGIVADSKRKLSKGDAVFQNEAIVTSSGAQGEFVLKDDTKLAVGPNSRIVLDKFVYDPKKNTGTLVLKATRGAFRFISGKSGSSAYTIKTPVASIAVRGTIFDGYINKKGEIAILLVKGEVDVCGTRCKPLKRVGRFIHVRRNGWVSNPMKWNGSFMKGVAIATAFPFVGRRLAIDPVRRLSPKRIMTGRALRRTLRTPGRVLRRGTRRKRGRSTFPIPRLPF